MLTYLLLLFLQCRPLSSYWTILPPPTPRTCLDETRLQLISGCWNTVMDVVLVVLPVVIVLRSRSLPRRQMGVVIGLFAAGWLVSLAGAVRTYLLYMLTTAPDHDFTWLSWASYLAASVELYLGIVSLSSPSLVAWEARKGEGCTNTSSRSASPSQPPNPSSHALSPVFSTPQGLLPKTLRRPRPQNGTVFPLPQRPSHPLLPGETSGLSQI